MTRLRAAPALVALAGLVAAGCGGAADGAGARVTVFAAASLGDAFGEVGDAFSARHPGVEVRLNLAGSSRLATQVLEGAPGDVLAVADQAAMARVVTAGAADGRPVVFARNTMQLAVPPGNPGGVVSLADLTRPELLVGICAEEVPCGRAARRLLRLAGIEPDIDTNEDDVRSLLTKVEAGELDAGLVYRTDVLAGGERVEGIAVPGADRVPVAYPITVLAGAGAPEEARAFVAFVRSGAGERILAAHGFLPG